jgi:anaerobic ribonucleoside-triphosphate reductase
MCPIETKHRQECEVYSRVTGYLTPIRQWNDAKLAEFKDRRTFKTK